MASMWKAARKVGKIMTCSHGIIAATAPFEDGEEAVAMTIDQLR